MNKLFFVLLIIAVSFSANSQEIFGTITNEDGQAIAYATIYIEELQTGTSANQNGMYNLRVSAGNFTLSYRALGYGHIVKSVTVEKTNIELNIVLPYQSYILAGVTVRADDEDPAYSIMRKVIARAPGFVNQAESYTSEVYIKGAVKATKLPKIIAKRMEVNGEQPVEGETYVNESINKIRFRAPSYYEQEVISVNNSFPIGDDDVPVIGLISGSIYESQDDFYISPFAPNAFSHYKFKYEGLLQDGAWFIDKIKVIPKRKSKLLMEGYVYIVEDLWCIYSYDMKLNPLYTNLEIKQFYAPVKGNNYFPVNLFVKAHISVMGIKADATYTTTIKYDSVRINPLFSQNKIEQAIIYSEEEIPEEKEVNPKVAAIDKKLEDLYKEDELSNREMVEMQKLMSKKAALLDEEKKENPLEILSNYKQIVKKDALVRDSLYWDSVRPVPASDEEKISYKKAQEKIDKDDSTSIFKKTIKTLGFGNYEWERSKVFHAFYPGVLAPRNIRFHPVDGLMLNQSFKMRWKVDDVHILRMKGKIGYAFEREKLFGEGQLSFWHSPKRMGFTELNYGYLSSDFNGNQSYLDGVNSLYNIFLKENYIKKYHTAFIAAKTSFELKNGLMIGSSFGYRVVDTLSNNTNFSVSFPNKDYEENVPLNSEIDSSYLQGSKKLNVSISFSYTPFRKYSFDKTGRKNSRGSKWPTFSLGYSTAIGINDDFEKYHSVGAGVSQKIDIYSVSELSYSISSGAFFGVENMHFSSFKHFKVVEEPFAIRDFNNSFFLINSYEYSTRKKYVHSKVKYTTQFLLLKRLPFISNKLWTENIYANALYVEDRKPYLEAGYTLGQLFFAGEAGVFVGFKGSEFHGFGVRTLFKF
ncbi:MAG: carboxypeptidase-like regulatory domain-containing protein [Salinivirgaceae bacterium]|nr:carboxypeptidase-like regulatory domain-containing protein [Salinivirgaceae bacterium]